MTYAKKLQQTTLLYIKKCTHEQAFQGGKPSRQFWLTRGFLFKQDPDIVNIVFDYLESKDSHQEMTLYDVIKSAKARQTELRWQEAKEQKPKQVKTNDAFSFDMLMNM